MDALKLKDLLLELIEELKIARITIAENEGRIQQLVKECHDKERKLEEEATKLQSLKDKHEETETILNKASDDKINHLEAEKTKLHLAGESLEKEMKTLKDEVRTLQISKYNLKRTVREQQHRLETQGQNKTSHSEQVVDIENRCKHLQKEMTSYSDTLSILKKEVTEAGVLNRMLSSTNNHQKCEISSLRDEIERKQQDIIKLRVHVAERPDDAGQEKIELKITQLQKELKQEAHINQELKIQLGETKLAHQVTQIQLKESQDLAERCMTSSKELTKKVALQETQVAALTKECASLSEQRTEANTESSGLRKEMEEWEAKKRSEMLVLEEEAEKAKTECSNLKKAVLNLEDINASWASKNQAMTNNIQRIKMELDSQAAELEKLKIPICKFDKDTQTLSSAGDDACRTDKEEYPANSACEKPMDVSAKDEQVQTEDRESRGLQVANGVNRESSLVEGLTTWNLSSGEVDCGLHQAKTSLHGKPSGKDDSSQEGKVDNSKDGDDTVLDELEVDRLKTKEPFSEIFKDHTSSSSSVKAMVKEVTQAAKENRESKQVNVMDGQKPKEPSSENNRENSVEATPMRLDTARKYMDDTGDGKQGVLTGQEDRHHQTVSTVDTVLSHDSVHLSDGMMMDPEKDAHTKVCGTSGQNANNLEFIITEKSLNSMSENLEITTNANCPVSSEASIVNQLLSPEISSSREAVMSLCKEDTLPPVQDIETSLEKTIHDETDVCARNALVARSSGVAALSENPDKADISDEDIVIPSTYAEENSTCRGEETVKVPECKTSCDHDDSMAEELPVTTGISEDQMGFSVSSTSQKGLKNIFTEPAKTLPIAPESKTGDGKSDRTTKPSLTDTSQRSGDLSMSKERRDASKKNTVERRSISETADTETVSLEKDSSQYIRRLRSFSSTDEEGVRLAATYLRGLGSFNSSTRKEHCTSLTTETSYLQTPKRKCTPAFHHVTSPPLDLKTVTCLPNKTAPFSYLSNSEPLTLSSITTLQKPSSLAKTKFTSPIMMTGMELRNAASYASWKTPELQLHTQQQQQEGKVMTQNPAIFSRFPSSAQQLHQSLYPLTPSTASQKIQSVHPSSTSLSSLSEQSVDPPRTHPQWQECVPKTSCITTANETHRAMPRLTRGRTFLEQSSDKDDREKTSSKTTSVSDSTVTSPKRPAVSINLKSWLPPGMDQTDPGGMHGGGGDAGGEVSLFSDEETDEDMKDGVASQIDRIQSFLQKDRLKRAKLE